MSAPITALHAIGAYNRGRAGKLTSSLPGPSSRGLRCPKPAREADAVTRDHLPPTPGRRPDVHDLGFDPEPLRAAEEVRRRLPHVTNEQFLLVAARHYGESAERIVAAVAQAWPRHEGAPGLSAGAHFAAVQRGVDSLLGEGNLTPTLGQIASRLGIDPATLRRWRHQDPSIEDLVR